MEEKFSSSHFRHLQKIENMSLKKKVIILAIILIIFNPPISLMFWSSWHLSLLAFDFKIGIFSIIPIVISNLMMVKLVLRLVENLSIRQVVK
jgi:hypothetical protein